MSLGQSCLHLGTSRNTAAASSSSPGEAGVLSKCLRTTNKRGEAGGVLAGLTILNEVFVTADNLRVGSNPMMFLLSLRINDKTPQVSDLDNSINIVSTECNCKYNKITPDIMTLRKAAKGNESHFAR